MGPGKSPRLRSKPTLVSTDQQPRAADGLIALRYEETVPAKAPLAVTVPPPREPPTEKHPALRSPAICGEDVKDPSKRDSGLAPTTSSKAREGSVNTVDENVLGLSIDFDAHIPPAAAPQTPSKSPSTEDGKNVSTGPGSMSRWRKPTLNPPTLKIGSPRTPTSARDLSSTSEDEFSPITTPIPTDSFVEADFLNQLSFTNRGSMMLDGKKAVGRRRDPSVPMATLPAIKVLPDDLEQESQKVRSMYESGADWGWQEDKISAVDIPPSVEETVVEEEPANSTSHLSPLPSSASRRPESSMSTRSETVMRREYELAGGIEDWEHINGKDIDRYGFINLQSNYSTPGSPEPRPMSRVSTVLQLASTTPRKKRTFGSSRLSFGDVLKKSPGKKPPTKSLNTQGSGKSQRSTSREQIRAAANRLPRNRDRRLMDEAGDMLTLPPGLADIAEGEEGGQAVEGLKKKEWDRAEKWRKMAKVVKMGQDGEGMEFEFDSRNPKVIERTWKGIPDRWRAAAWYSFLSTSAKKWKDSATDDQLIEAFNELQQRSSADDVQIDVDVPRTINSHIMFRRRYRGGQRLLFRVLRALSLYFPETGYVQGMASLAATLLCYYDEEKTFIMLVRMWTLRGLDKLYEVGFPGLLAALDEFEKEWLDGRGVSKKLAELNIDPTAYGTRWYLTLFNYSIPFAAQLRIWDVFMLLGDVDPAIPTNKDRPFGGSLDVLHAASAALIDGTREILLDSDFENAMKALTSWIPIKDEELLMKVTKAEWKLHRGKKH